MDNARLAATLAYARDTEQAARALLQAENLAERDAALMVLRHVTALRKSLETWIATRALRAQWCGK